jgi:hypothetical protein
MYVHSHFLTPRTIKFPMLRTMFVMYLTCINLWFCGARKYEGVTMRIITIDVETSNGAIIQPLRKHAEAFKQLTGAEVC